MPFADKDVCSKKKMIEYLKSLRIKTENTANDYHYMFTLGVNSTIDIMIVGIYANEFDKPKEQKAQAPKQKPETI